MGKRKTGVRILSWAALLCALTAALTGGLPALRASAATLQPSNVVTQGTTVIKSYNCSIAAQRNSVGSTNSSQTYQIDLTGAGRIEALTERYHGKCGNCNGSAGYTGASLSVSGAGSCSVGTDADGTIALTDLEKYHLGITSVVLNANAGVVNVCPSCGGCGTQIMTIKSVKTYSYAPKITKHPAGCSAETDTAAVFAAEGSRIACFSWEQKAGGVFVPLTDAAGEDGMYYAGTNTKELKVGNIRYRGNQSVYRCVLTGENGEKLITNEAVLTVTDKTAPNAVITKNPAAWTNKAVCLSAEATDLDTGLAAAPYSWDGGITYTGQSSHAFAENGAYAVSIKDASGNLFQETVIITEIDRKAPVLCVSANTVTETKGAVTLLLTASDEDSGLCEKPYYYAGAWHPEAAFEVGKNGIYEVRAKDRAGNETGVTCAVKNIKAEEIKDGNSGGEQDNTDGGKEGGGNSKENSGGTGEVPSVPAPSVPSVLPLPSSSAGLTEKKKKAAAIKKEETTEKKEVRVGLKKNGEPKEEVRIEVETTEEEPDVTAVLQPFVPEAKGNGIWLTVLAGFLGLLIFALLSCFLFFGVRIEEPDMDGEGWRLYTIRPLYRSRGFWHVGLGKALEECGTLRLRFGVLLLALFEGWELILHIKGREEGTLETELCQKLVVDGKRMRRS